LIIHNLKINNMAGNPKTKKSVAIKGAEAAKAKGVKVGLNPKAGVQSSAPKMKKGGMVGKKKC
jgi:hypothetical protein